MSVFKARALTDKQWLRVALYVKDNAERIVKFREMFDDDDRWLTHLITGMRSTANDASMPRFDAVRIEEEELREAIILAQRYGWIQFDEPLRPDPLPSR